MIFFSHSFVWQPCQFATHLPPLTVAEPFLFCSMNFSLSCFNCFCCLFSKLGWDLWSSLYGCFSSDHNFSALFIVILTIFFPKNYTFHWIKSKSVLVGSLKIFFMSKRICFNCSNSSSKCSTISLDISHILFVESRLFQDFLPEF